MSKKATSPAKEQAQSNVLFSNGIITVQGSIEPKHSLQFVNALSGIDELKDKMSFPEEAVLLPVNFAGQSSKGVPYAIGTVKGANIAVDLFHNLGEVKAQVPKAFHKEGSKETMIASKVFFQCKRDNTTQRFRPVYSM